MSKIELLLHPVRMRIILAISGRTLTPAQIAAALPDVAQTSLYRQVNTLTEGGMLQVVGERQVRGTVEKTYALVGGAASLKPDELERLSDEDHERYFTVFLSSLLADLSRYLATRPDDEPVSGRVTYNRVPLYLTDDERQTLIAQIVTLLRPYTNAPDDATARRYHLALVSLPDIDEGN